MNKIQKIGIIYFDERHIIPHFITVVKELFLNNHFEVEILTYQAKHSYLYELLEENNLPKTLVKQLPTYRYRKISEKIKGRKIPSSLYLFKKHKNMLLSYDALIFNDINHEYLYSKRQGISPKFVLLMHGAGDGVYMIAKQYESSISKFDLICTSGKKVTEFFDKMHLPSTKIAVCGYQKFDLINNKSIPKFFDNNKPTVIYNPHFKKELSSWYQFGLPILEYFYQNDDYNLIFAPHINLFNKKGFLKSDIIPQKYFDTENILIDLGSKHSVNMGYTLSANIYLGDVSSQIYEFLYMPRPSIFINAYDINWINNPHYKNWHLGKVIKDISDLNNLLHSANQWQKEFVQKQEEMMQYTFDTNANITASACITNAIDEILTKAI